MHSFWNFAQLFKAYWRCACVFVAHKKYNFWKNYCNFDFDISDISLQYWLNWMCWGSWVRMVQGVRTGLGHGGITCVLQTQFSSFFYYYFFLRFHVQNSCHLDFFSWIILCLSHLCHAYMCSYVGRKFLIKILVCCILYWNLFLRTCIFPAQCWATVLIFSGFYQTSFADRLFSFIFWKLNLFYIYI